MTSKSKFTKAERESITDNWSHVRNQLRSQYSNVSEADLQAGRDDPEAMADTISERTGFERADVVASIRELVKS